jgi:guanine nucleotide-binding protein G(i) subunit alpha
MESGKSTIMKQMRIMSDDRYFSAGYCRPEIYESLLVSAKTVITSMRELDLEPAEQRNQEYSDFLMEYTLDPHSDTPLESKVGDAISSLWKDENINKLTEYRTEVYLADSTP